MGKPEEKQDGSSESVAPPTSEENAMAVWTSLVNLLAPGRDQSDEDFATRKLIEHRHECLSRIVWNQVRLEEYVLLMKDALKRNDKSLFADLEKSASDAKKGVNLWETRLKAIRKLEDDEFIKKI